MFDFARITKDAANEIYKIKCFTQKHIGNYRCRAIKDNNGEGTEECYIEQKVELNVQGMYMY